MPHFYFHIREGTDFIPDEEGMDFPDLAAAMEEAEQSARELVIERIKALQSISSAMLEVVNQDGVVMDTLFFRNSIH